MATPFVTFSGGHVTHSEDMTNKEVPPKLPDYVTEQSI
jgi:hypothetical protein